MQKKVKISEATSLNNGVYFYSKRHKGYVALATIDEEGDIKTEWITAKEIKNRNNNDKKRENIMTNLYGFVSCIVIFISFVITKDIMASARIFLFWCILTIILILNFQYRYVKRKEKNLYKFHAAEHMAANAYLNLKRAPTLEEIKEYSRFNSYCGSSQVIEIILILFIAILCTFLTNIMYMLIVMIFSGVIIILLQRIGIFNFIQRLVTETPTDRELKVAIEAMRLWLNKEKS